MFRIATGLGLAAPDYADIAACELYAARLRELRVVLCDFGTACPADPSHRPPPGGRDGEDPLFGPFCYRAPEVLLEDKDFGEGVDTWALGCVLAELGAAANQFLFPGQSADLVLLRIFERMAPPGPAGSLARLPLCEPALLRGLAGTGLPEELDGEQRRGLEALLQLEPARRPSMKAVAAWPDWQEQLLLQRVCVKAALAERGCFTMVQGQLVADVLRWLQADPYWEGISAKIGRPTRRKGTCFTEAERRFKHEEGGFTGARRP